MSRTMSVAGILSHASRRRSIHAPLLLAVAYLAGAKVGLAFTFEPRPVSVLWLPNAILLSALLLTPTRQWYVMLGAALVAHMSAQLPANVPLPMAACWFISNTGEALIGAALIRRYGGYPFRLDRLKHVGIFASAALLAVFVSCFVDAAFVALNRYGSSGYWSVWRVRFFSNTLAALTLAPAIVGMAGVRLSEVRNAEVGRIVEGIALTVLLLVTNAFVFGYDTPDPTQIAGFLYVPLPFLLWAAVRFGPGAAGTAVFVTVLTATTHAVDGRGPFVSASAESNALQIQLLFSVVALTQVALAAVVAERQQADLAARRSGEQLRLAVEAARMKSWDWVVSSADLDDVWRSAMLRPLEAGLGRIHPSDRLKLARAFRHSLRRAAPLDINFRVVRADGEVRWIHGQGRVLRDSRRRQIQIAGLSADITDQKLAEALNRGESRILEMIATGASLRTILSSIVRLIESESLGVIGSILLLDRDGVHMRHYAAPSLPDSYVRHIDGLSIGPDVGSCGAAMYLKRPVYALSIRDDPRWADYRELALRHGLRSCWSTPILSTQGGVLGSFAIYYNRPRQPSPREHQLVDIATQLAVIAIERRRAEFELSEQRMALTHLGRVAILSELSVALAHELSHPLTAILSDAQAAYRLLDPSSERDAGLREILDEIVAAERRASRVIEQTRTMLVKRPPQRVPMDLNALIVETLELIRRDMAAREVMVRTRLATTLPPVLAVRSELQQVLLNILINAFDAMRNTPPAERVITITTSTSQHGRDVAMSVSDRGSGIPPDQMAHIFDPFHTAKENGLGLGLSMCRSIVFAHGGRLTARNNPVAGATFDLELPLLIDRKAGGMRRGTGLLAGHEGT